MKRITICFSLVVLFSIVFVVAQVSVQPKPGGAEQELIRLEKGWTDAMVRRDIAYFESNLAEEFFEDGILMTRTEYIAALKSGEFVAQSAVLDDIKVRVYGDAAVTCGRTTLKGQYKGEDVSGCYRWTDTWIMRAGRWQCVAGHGSKVVALPPPVASVEQELMELEKRGGVAIVQRDFAFLDRILSEDAIDTESDGVVSTRAQMLASLKSGEVIFTSFVLDNMKSHVYGDAAVVFGRTTLAG